MNDESPRSAAASTLLEEAAARRKRALTYAVLVAAGAGAASFIVLGILKALPVRGTLMDLVILAWNAVVVVAPFAGVVVYRRMR